MSTDDNKRTTTDWSIRESLLVYKSSLSESELTWKQSRGVRNQETIVDDGFTFDPSNYEEENHRSYTQKQFACRCHNKSSSKFSYSKVENASHDYRTENAADKERNKAVEEKVKTGNWAMTNQQFQEAVLLFSEAIGGNPDKALIWIKRCTCLMFLEQFNLAANDALQAIKLEKHNRLAYCKLMDCYLETGDIDKTEDVIRTFMNIFTGSKPTQAEKVTELKQLKEDINKAFSEKLLLDCLELIDKALKLAPACPDLKFERVHCLVALEKLDEIDKNLVEQNIVQVLILYYKGFFVDSLKLLETSPLMSSENKAVHSFRTILSQIIQGVEKADNLSSQENFIAAIDTLQSMVTIDRTNNELIKGLYRRIASAHFCDKRFVQATTFADYALKIDGSFFEAIILKANCFFELKNFQGVLGECENILKRNASESYKDAARQLKTKAEAKIESQKPKEPEVPPAKANENPTPKGQAANSFNSSYSSENVNKEKVDNSDFFASFTMRDENLGPRRTSTQYSFSSADTKSDPKFKEFVGKPKKAEPKTYQQLQDDIRAQQKNQQGNRDYFCLRYHNAIKSYSDAIAILAKNSIYYNNRAACYMKLGEFELAAADAARSIDHDPENWRSFSRVINCFLLLGNINQAENYIEKFKNNVPGVESIKFNEIPKLKSLKELDAKITRYYDEDSFQECLKNIEEACKIAKSSIKYRNFKIKCLIMLDRAKEADLMINLVLIKYPKHCEMFYLIGLKYYQLGELTRCIEMLETSLKINPDMKSAQALRLKAKEIWKLYEEGLKNYKSGHFYESYSAFFHALKADKTNSKFRQILFFNLGSANFKLDKFTAAIENFNEALRLDEAHVKSLTRRAEAHFKLKEYEDCIVDCKEAMKLEKSESVRKLLSDAKFSISVRKGQNAYKILGVDQNATKEEIRKAFHKLSLMFHSDKNPKATAVEKKKLERKFQEAKDAYNIGMSFHS